MREQHGVMELNDNNVQSLKRLLLLFDKLHTFPLGSEGKTIKPINESFRADIDFLTDQGVIVPMKIINLEDPPGRYAELDKVRQDKTPHIGLYAKFEPAGLIYAVVAISDLIARSVAAEAGKHGDAEAAPICQLDPTDRYLEGLFATVPLAQTVARVAISAFPMPDEASAWEDLIAFKQQEHDQLWGFRRLMRALATKQQTEAEIRDDIEWSTNEYTKAMKIHHIKASQSFIDVFLITPLEIIENLVKFNWSKIAKGILQVHKRKAELLEAEMKAPGRECAYVFDARKRFGGNS